MLKAWRGATYPATVGRILPMLLAEIARAADPDQALNHWERLFAGASNRASLLNTSSPRPGCWACCHDLQKQ